MRRISEGQIKGEAPRYRATSRYRPRYRPRSEDHYSRGQIRAWVDDRKGNKIPFMFLPVRSIAIRNHGPEELMLAQVPFMKSGADVVVEGFDMVHFTVESVDDDVYARIQLFEDGGGYGYLVRALVGKPVVLDEKSKALLEEMAIKDQGVIGRYSHFIIGCHKYSEIWKRVNNNGLPGAYAPCFEDFKVVVDGASHDLVWLEAVRLLMCAKMLNGDVVEGKKVAEQLATNSVSVTYRLYGEHAKQSIARLHEQVDASDAEK